MTVIKVLGLPGSEHRFWPRLLGAVLIGLAAATLIEGWLPGSRGLSLAGCIAINLTSAAMMAISLITGTPRPPARGRYLLWLVIAILALLSLVEIAYA